MQRKEILTKMSKSIVFSEDAVLLDNLTFNFMCRFCGCVCHAVLQFFSKAPSFVSNTFVREGALAINLQTASPGFGTGPLQGEAVCKLFAHGAYLCVLCSELWCAITCRYLHAYCTTKSTQAYRRNMK